MSGNPFDQLGVDFSAALPPTGGPPPAADGGPQYGAPPPMSNPMMQGGPPNPYGGYGQSDSSPQPNYGGPSPSYGQTAPAPVTPAYDQSDPFGGYGGGPAPEGSSPEYGQTAASSSNPFGGPPNMPSLSAAQGLQQQQPEQSQEYGQDYGQPPPAPEGMPPPPPSGQQYADPWGAPPAAAGYPGAPAPPQQPPAPDNPWGAPPPAPPASSPYGAPPPGANPYGAPPPDQQYGQQHHEYGMPPQDPQAGAMVPSAQPSNPYALAPYGLPPQQNPYAAYGQPPAPAAVDPFSVFEQQQAAAAAAAAAHPEPVGYPTSDALVVAAPHTVANVPQADDDFWGSFGAQPPPAQQQQTQQPESNDAGASGTKSKGGDDPAASEEKKNEEGLPPGGEWYDARIFTPTLGVMFFKPQELTDSLFLNTERSIVDALGERPVVAFIVEGSSARSAGVELGHVLLKVNGVDVKNPKEASRLIKEGPRPLPLLFYVPNTDVVVAEGEHMVKYDTRDTTAPNSAKDWKPKYVVIGGIIAQPWMMNMYRSKSEYDIAVIETQARRPVSVKVKQFSLQGARIQNDWQGPQMVKYKNKLHPWKYIVVLPVARNPIKISSPNLSQLKPVHEGIRRVLLAQQRNRGPSHNNTAAAPAAAPRERETHSPQRSDRPPAREPQQQSTRTTESSVRPTSNQSVPAPEPDLLGSAVVALPPPPQQQYHQPPPPQQQYHQPQDPHMYAQPPPQQQFAQPPPQQQYGSDPYGGGGYGAPPPQQPPQAYGAPPPQYGAPPPQYGAPPPQYGAPPPQYGADPFGGQGPPGQMTSYVPQQPQTYNY